MSRVLTIVVLILLAVVQNGCDSIGGRSADEYIASAKKYIENEEFKPAAIELKNALQQAPDNAMARRMLGEIYLTLGDSVSAQKELERASELGAAPESTQPLLARALLHQHDYEGVLAIEPSQYTLPPKAKASLHASRGMALIGLNRFDEAAAEFKQGLAGNDNSLEVLTGMAWLATARQQPEKARGYLEQVFAIDPDYAEAWSLLGNIEQSQHNLDAALEAYTKAASNHADNMMDVVNQIRLNIALGNNKEAKTEIAAQRKRGHSSFLLDHLEGLLAYQEKRYKDARISFENVLKVKPDHLPSLMYAGAANLMDGNLEQARAYLLRFNSKQPGAAPVLKMLAWIAMKNEDYTAAEKYIRQVLAEQPDDMFSLNLLASALMGNNQTLQGQEVLRQIVALHPDSADARMQLGVSMIREGELDSALEELEAARALDPSVQKTSLAIIFTYLKNNELDKALEQALALREAHHDSAVANAALGTVYLARQENDKAAQAFRDTLAVDADNVTANSGLATLAVLAGNTDKAKTFYRKILEKHPENLNTSMNLAYLSALDGDVDEMQAVLKQAIEANPESLLPRLALSRFYTKQNEYDKVIELLQPVRDIGRSNPVYLELLSQAQYRTREFAGARSSLESLLELTPDNASSHYLLALTYRKLGDKAGYRSQLKRVLTLNPDHVGARTLMTELIIADGDTEAARKSIDLLRKQSGETAETFLLEGQVASSLAEYDKAVSAYRNALKLEETNHNMLKLEAAMWGADKHQAAIDLLTSWLEKYPSDEMSQTRLASRFLTMGRESDAVETYTEILKQDPDNAVALNNLAWLLRDSDPKRALEYAEKAHSLAPASPSISDTLAMLISESDSSRAQKLIREALNASPGNPHYLYHQALIYERANDPERARQIVEKLLKDAPEFSEAEEAKRLMERLKN